jgi:hypothetical protein
MIEAKFKYHIYKKDIISHLTIIFYKNNLKKYGFVSHNYKLRKCKALLNQKQITLTCFDKQSDYPKKKNEFKNHFNTSVNCIRFL